MTTDSVQKEIAAFREAALAVLPSLIGSLVEEQSLPEPFLLLASRYATLKSESGLALERPLRFFGEAASIFAASSLEAAQACHDSIPDVPEIPFAGHLKDALWARYQLSNPTGDRARLLYELGGALIQLIFPWPGMRVHALPRVIRFFGLSVEAYLETGDAGNAADPATMFTALSNELGEESDTVESFFASLQLGERVLGSVGTTSAHILSRCMLAHNMMNACRDLAKRSSATAATFLNRAAELAESIESWATQCPPPEQSEARHLAFMRLRTYRSAADIQYELAAGQLKPFAACAETVVALCRRGIAVARENEDADLFDQARRMTRGIDARLRLLRPDWRMDPEVWAVFATIEPEEPDLEAWMRSGEDLVRGLEELDEADDRTRYIDDALRQIHERLAAAFVGIVKQVGVNHHVCRLLLALGAVSSGRFGAASKSMWPRWLVMRETGRSHIDIAQNETADEHLRMRVLREITVLDALLTGLEQAGFGTVATIRRSLVRHQARLLADVFGSRPVAARTEAERTQAADIASVLFRGLPHDFAHAAFVSMMKGVWSAPPRPTGTFQVRHRSSEPTESAGPEPPVERGLVGAEFLPKLQLEDPSPASSHPEPSPGEPPQQLDEFLRDNRDFTDESLVGKLVNMHHEDYVIGRVIGRGRHKVAFELLDPATGKPAVSRATGQSVIMRIERTRSTASTDSPDLGLADAVEEATSLSSVRDALPYLRMFTAGALESAWFYLTQGSSQWHFAVDLLVEQDLVAREWVPGLKGVYLRFRPGLAAVLESFGLADPAAAEERFLRLYDHLVNEVIALAAAGNGSVAKAFVTVDAANIEQAMRIALRAGRRASVARLSQLLSEDLLPKAIFESTRDLRKIAADWLADSAPADTVDEGYVLTREERAWEKFRSGDQDGAIEALRQLADSISRYGASGLREPRFHLGVVLFALGQMLSSCGRDNEALLPLRQAMESFETDRTDYAKSNLRLVQKKLVEIYRDAGAFAEALRLAEGMRELAAETGSSEIQTDALLVSIQTLLVAQQFEAAKPLIEQAAALASDRGSLHFAAILHAEATVLFQEGKPDVALEKLEMALEIQERNDDQWAMIMLLNSKGLAEVDCGWYEAAEQSYERARSLSRTLNPRSEVAITHNLCRLYRKRAEAESEPPRRRALLERAIMYGRESREIGSRMRNPVAIERACQELAILLTLIGDFPQSRAHALERLAIREEMGATDLYLDHIFLAELAREAGEIDEAWQWQDKVDQVLAPDALQRIREGGGLPQEILSMFGAASAAIVEASGAGQQISQQHLDFLRELSRYSPPIGTFAMMLIELATRGTTRETPAWMPVELAEMLKLVRNCKRSV